MKARFLIETDGTFVPLKGTTGLCGVTRGGVRGGVGGGVPALKGPSDLTPHPPTVLTVQPVVPLARGLYYGESRLGIFGLCAARCCKLFGLAAATAERRGGRRSCNRQTCRLCSLGAAKPHQTPSGSSSTVERHDQKSTPRVFVHRLMPRVTVNNVNSRENERKAVQPDVCVPYVFDWQCELVGFAP